MRELRSGLRHCEEASPTKQSMADARRRRWIASRSLSSGRPSAGPVGSQ